jgi:glutathione S-transferase
VITLHQFARVWGIPNLSPFCCKVETWLRMAGIPYRVADAIPPNAPKGKLPFVIDEGRTITDSRFILEYLTDHYGVDLDAGLTPAERAVSLAVQRMIEDELHWAAVIWPRWCQPHNWPACKQSIFGGFPPVLRDLAAAWAKRQIHREIWGHGIGRNRDEEIVQIGRQDLDALSTLLADKAFFLGASPTTLDACAFGLLSNVLWPPIESELAQHARGHANLVAFCDRVRDRYFREMPALDQPLGSKRSA